MFLAIDPGRAKCGWALFDADSVVGRGIWERGEVERNLAALAQNHRIDLIVLGNRTGHRGLFREFAASPEWRDRVRLVEEGHSSEEARRQYVRETARGWRRLIPLSLRYPDGPYDDYVAVILGRRYLAGMAGDRPPVSGHGNSPRREERRGG